MKSGFLEPRTAFIGPPVLVEEIEGTSLWRLQRDVVYKTSDGDLITAPAGMLTDFASVPRLFWVIYPPWDRNYGRASVIHDFLYQHHGHTSLRNFTRRECDLVFMDAMKDLGAGYFKRHTIFNAVRIGNREWPDESHEDYRARTFFHRHV